VLSDPAVELILHDAPQDLILLARWTGAAVRTIFDTRTAAGFAGLSATTSLADLARDLLGEHLPKTETRTDWLRRPLGEKQRLYALDDVRVLPLLREELGRRLEATGRDEWLAEEMRPLEAPSLLEEADPREQYRRVKGGGRLAPRDAAVLRELAAWREEEARRRDLPRRHLLDDASLVLLARRRPAKREALPRLRGEAAKHLSPLAGPILEAIRRGERTPEEECPAASRKREQDEGFAARADLALAALKGTCLAEGVDPALVATRAQTEELVRRIETPEPPETTPTPLLAGWRAVFVGRRLEALLRGEATVRIDPADGLPRLGAE
jgi:ribonuclease D